MYDILYFWKEHKVSSIYSVLAEEKEFLDFFFSVKKNIDFIP